MKILANELEQSSGTCAKDKTKDGHTKTSQFAYEEIKVSDCVIMGLKRFGR